MRKKQQLMTQILNVISMIHKTQNLEINQAYKLNKILINLNVPLPIHITITGNGYLTFFNVDLNFEYRSLSFGNKTFNLY